MGWCKIFIANTLSYDCSHHLTNFVGPLLLAMQGGETKEVALNLTRCPPPAGIAAAPCCSLRHGLLNWRRRKNEAHVQFSKPQAGKTGLA
jgi:hypothetical protein